MIGSKQFALLTAIVIVLLLAIGNWATPAQATNTGLIGVTPTPTGTPVGTPNTLPGKIPSAEEQEE